MVLGHYFGYPCWYCQLIFFGAGFMTILVIWKTTLEAEEIGHICQCTGRAKERD